MADYISVPREPTEAMLVNGREALLPLIRLDSDGPLIGVWKDMIAAATEEAGGWRDISTAPKDGTEVLVARLTKGRWTVRVARTHEAGYGGQGWVTVPGDWSLKPTHWRPLPQPPQPQEHV